MTDDRSVRSSFIRRNMKYVAGGAVLALLALSAPSMATAANAGNVKLSGSSSLAAKATIYVKKSDVVKGKLACAGTTYTPYSSGDAVDSSDSLRFSTSGAIVRCNLALPNHARLVQAHWAIQDSDAGADLSCEVWRTKATGTGIGGETKLADAASTGAPGAARINSPVTDGVINNDKYSYFTQCRLSSTSDIGVYGSSFGYFIRADGRTPPAPKVAVAPKMAGPSHSGL
jgi:hypothetical protein